MFMINGFKCVTKGFIAKSINIQYQPHLHHNSIRTLHFSNFSFQGNIYFTFQFLNYLFIVFSCLLCCFLDVGLLMDLSLTCRS